ncbi:M15 family metallopeptidase [Methylocella silvestris]|uniref:D-alanyl-D-alanine dipeptidase n=1 Tax=Methylocella silvestris TaxID=199596 RepID=A0A2J7THR2_METSI|nr:M15 family metallopeptidase [Methylocella silvestris]PNG26302.1 peptidase M15 [Methylocella silvestris]
MNCADKPFATLLTSSGGCRDQAGPRGEPPENFVRLGDVAPRIRQEMRYAGSENFMGRPVPGYCAGQCWLRREVAKALAAVQSDAESGGRSLVVYDCYRPQRATRAFIAWAGDPADELMKEEYYPHLGKETLFDLGYIARESAHSTGVAVDLALIGLDFGTPFDLFDEASGSHFAGLSAEAKQNRAELFALMERHGFVNFDKEWWHFTLENLEGVAPHDFDVR